MGRIHQYSLAASALAVAVVIHSPTVYAQETETETETEAETETETETETEAEAEAEAETETGTDPNDPLAGAETIEEMEAASGVVPGQPEWMTPELYERLQDPEEREQIEDYFHQSSLEWEPQWSSFGWADGGTLIGLGLVGIIGQFAPEPTGPRWTGGILGDDDIRSALVLETYDERESMAVGSDNLLALLVIYPFLVDGVIMSLLIHEAPEAAAEMMLVDTLAYAITFAIVNVTKKAVARERPFVQECAGNPGYADGCNPNDHSRNASFISGHSAFSFTAAGLMCAQHINMPIHGDPVADYSVCGAGLLAATSVALMRIGADRHWASDVWTGAAVGLLSGWLMPTLLRYQSWNPLPQTENVAMVPMPQIGPDRFGLGVTGIF